MNLHTHLKKLIVKLPRMLIKIVTDKMTNTDKISVLFLHHMFNAPITIPFIYKKDFTIELLEEYFLT